MNRPDYTAFDAVVVYRLVLGDRPDARTRPPDATEATRRLAALGYSDGQIAYRLGYTRRQVVRIRARLGIAAALGVGGNRWTRPHDAPARPLKAG